MKKIFPWILLLPVLPLAVVSWLLVLLAIVLQMAEARELRVEGAGILTTNWRPWVVKVYPYSVTLGRAMIFYPGHRSALDGMDEGLEKHELVHIAQLEDVMLNSMLVGLVLALVTGNGLLGFAVWCSGAIWKLPNYLTALLRYGHLVKWPATGTFASKFTAYFPKLTDVAYRDCEHERSAYAQTSLYIDAQGNVTSWDVERDNKRSEA